MVPPRCSILFLLTFALGACSSAPRAEEHRSAVVPHATIGTAMLRGLVDVRASMPDIVCDLRYGTRQNVTGQALYPPDMPCLLHQRTAEKLLHAQSLLRAQGFGLKIWDAWRPPEVQTELFRYGQKTGRGAMFVNPQEAWSFHCCGTAVDVTLVDKDGRELPMPTCFDEAGPRAHIFTPPSSELVRRHIRALQNAMLQSGFGMIDAEWWHFDDRDFNSDNTHQPVVFAHEIGLTLPVLR